ncbi:unnamed protein product [Arctogadus glacialis]
MLIYSEARKPSPAAADTVLQIEIADGLGCDRRPKVRHLVIYLLRIPSSLPPPWRGQGREFMVSRTQKLRSEVRGPGCDYGGDHGCCCRCGGPR